MTWMIYYLCKNPDIKERIVTELETILPDQHHTDQTLSFTKVNNIRLLEHAEIECLRLHPPIGYAMPRDTPPNGTVICGHYIPGGVAVGVPAATIGRNPSVYPDPHSWKPDRWVENAADLATMKSCFLGFGAGSRQCIGKNVANQFIIKMIANLLVKYDIQLEDPDLVLGTKEFTILKPDRSFRVILSPRTDSSMSHA